MTPPHPSRSLPLQADGGEAPCLYSLSVDGSLHAWTYAASAEYTLDNLAAPVAKRKRQEAAEAEAEKQRRLEEGGEEEEEEEDAARRKSGKRASTSSGEAAGEEGEEDGQELKKEERPFPYLAGAYPGLCCGRWAVRNCPTAQANIID